MAIDPKELEFNINEDQMRQKIARLESELRKYYLPCKQKIYFNNINILTNKEAITILRQLLKIHDYDLNSREKFIKGTKYSIYKIITKQDKIFSLHNKKNKEITINFD